MASSSRYKPEYVRIVWPIHHTHFSNRCITASVAFRVPSSWRQEAPVGDAGGGVLLAGMVIFSVFPCATASSADSGSFLGSTIVSCPRLGVKGKSCCHFTTGIWRSRGPAIGKCRRPLQMNFDYDFRAALGLMTWFHSFLTKSIMHTRSLELLFYTDKRLSPFPRPIVKESPALND